MCTLQLPRWAVHYNYIAVHRPSEGGPPGRNTACSLAAVVALQQAGLTGTTGNPPAASLLLLAAQRLTDVLQQTNIEPQQASQPPFVRSLAATATLHHHPHHLAILNLDLTATAPFPTPLSSASFRQPSSCAALALFSLPIACDFSLASSHSSFRA